MIENYIIHQIALLHILILLYSVFSMNDSDTSASPTTYYPEESTLESGVTLLLDVTSTGWDQITSTVITFIDPLIQTHPTLAIGQFCYVTIMM